MKFKPQIFFFMLCLGLPFTAMAQKVNQGPENIVKINLSSLALNNYSFQYERKLSHKISFGLGFRFMPQGALPFHNSINSIINKNQSSGSGNNNNNNDSSFKNAVTNSRMSDWAVTAEVRFYFGKKGFGRNFYVAPYVRYTQFSLNIPYTFTDQNNQPHNMNLQGNLTGFGAGLMLGKSFMIKKIVVLDIWILGPMIGPGRVNVNATADLSQLSDQDKQTLKDNIQNVGIPTWTLTANVSNTGVQATGNGALIGVRGLGFNVGIAF
ncbi:MAG TPA: DUF3575 domain-containing protein [Chitinophagaceae bacterium]|nr:DUF3575 domain-containing protein [Chitinophagaceae bacterium]